MRSDRDRLQDILDAIQKIEKYAGCGEAAFLQDEMMQVWMVRHLEIVGEAARGLTLELRQQHPQVIWAEIIRMRNILVHDYFRINNSIVWSVVQNDLPSLKRQIERVLATLQSH